MPSVLQQSLAALTKAEQQFIKDFEPGYGPDESKWPPHIRRVMDSIRGLKTYAQKQLLEESDESVPT